MNIYRLDKPFILSIFGASGDLAKLKLFPALYSLAEQKRLPKNYAIVGFARTKKTQQQFRQEFVKSVKMAYGKEVDAKILKDLTEHVHYFSGHYDDQADYSEYSQFLIKIAGRRALPHLVYFSVPPTVFKPIIKNLGLTKAKQHQDTRLIIEKPFGHDTISAENLCNFITRYFKESDTYLLDHYLGKSGVHSIINLRQSNRILNTLLKGREIANIQINALESINVKERIGYFDQVGTVTDMIQSHLLQLLALTAMNAPMSKTAKSLQREKRNILSALHFPRGNNLVRGQYDQYSKQAGIQKHSKTETFAAIKLLIDQEDWYETPLYIRTGKSLTCKNTSIIVEFKKLPFQEKKEKPNLLVIEISPHEQISIQLVNKYRSGENEYEAIHTTESIACSGDYCLPPHGLLLLDVMRKNRMNFLSFPEVIASWEITEKILTKMRKGQVKLIPYKSGSMGPKEQYQLTKQDGFHWHDELLNLT